MYVPLTQKIAIVRNVFKKCIISFSSELTTFLHVLLPSTPGIPPPFVSCAPCMYVCMYVVPPKDPTRMIHTPSVKANYLEGSLAVLCCIHNLRNR